MHSSTFSQQIADALYNSSEPFPVLFEDAWQWLGYLRKDAAKRKFMSFDFVSNIDFNLHNIVEVRQEGDRTVNRTLELISLTVDCFKMWGMMANTPQGKEVRLYFLDCERRAKDKQVEVLTPAEQNLRTAQLLLDHERRTLALEQQAKQHADKLESHSERLENVEVQVRQTYSAQQQHGYWCGSQFYTYP